MSSHKRNLSPLVFFLYLSYSVAQAQSFWKTDLNENLTHVTKIKGSNGFTDTTLGKPWPGFGPNGEAPNSVLLPYSRIPAMTITDDNKMVVMFDLRWNRAADQDRIDPGLAISEDGGHTWERKTAWNFNDSKMPQRRAMDPTILYNSIDGSLYVMHGTWSAGSRNWYQDRFNYFNDNIWAATIHKSTDGGKTWEKNAEFSKTSNLETFAKVQRNGNPTIAFLGGVGSGIVMRDGTLVFPIQTAHSDGIATTIMYSKDNGKSWDMPEIKNALGPNQSSLENMVFEIDNKLVMTGRESRIKGTQAGPRWAYYTEDLGKTWHPYKAAEFGSSTAQPTQGSSIYVTLPNGRRVLLVSKPNGNNDSWSRGNIALWMLDAKDPTHVHEVTIIRPGSGNAAGAGYSSLAYKEGNLFAAFEDDGNITVKNLTEYMQSIQDKAMEWGLPDEIESEVQRINSLTHLNQGQKDELIAKMRRANDNAIAQSFVIDQAMLNVNKNITALDKQAEAMNTALPSRRHDFQNSLNNVKNILSPDNKTYLDYLGVQSLYDNLYATFLALNTKVDFSKYVSKAENLNEYDTEILYRSFDNVFIHYDAGSKHNHFSLGLNSAITNNLNAGVFFKFSNKNQKSYQIGARAKYQLDNHNLSGFIRYRSVKHQDFLERNNNIDGYLNYAYQFKINEQLSLRPFIGGYASYSAKTLIDEDVAVNKRMLYAGDIGLNINYQLNDIQFYIRPNIALIKDGMTLSQSNYAQNKYDVHSINVVYGLHTGIEKRFSNNLAIGSDLQLQKYGSHSSDVNLGVNLSYQW